MPSGPKAPSHLRRSTATWWRGIVRDYELDAHHLRLLTLAAEALDRCGEARERLAADGTYLVDRFGQVKAHPAVVVERDARMAVARLLRELDLDGTPAPDPRPPALARSGGWS